MAPPQGVAPHPTLHEALERHFGYPGFRPGQERLVRAALEGRDALGVLPTGGGKSVCYMLPAALLPGLTVVVSPLVSLMSDQVVRARAAGIPAAALHSGLPVGERRATLAEVRAGRVRLLLVAPERFGVARFRRAMEGVPVSLMAVDESHCISQWGHDFRPSYLALGSVRGTLRAPCMALTATATPAVREEIEGVLGLRRTVRVVGSFDRPNLRWAVARLRRVGERPRRAAALLRETLRRDDGVAVVYAATRRTAESARDAFARLGLPVAAYHAGMRSEARARVQEEFMSGRTPVVVATNAFGMGVDKPDVRLVLHLAVSGSLEAYYQEAGRGGRDGEPARCIVLHARGDQKLHRSFLDRSRPPVRALRRLHRCVADRLGGGGGGDLSVTELSRRLGRGWSPERTEAGLRALAGAGLARIEGAAEGPSVSLSLRPGPPDFRRARALRRAGVRRLRSVRRYVHSRRCRRRILLGYFGERSPAGPCGGCDRCDPAL